MPYAPTKMEATGIQYNTIPLKITVYVNVILFLLLAAPSKYII
jgi:hypothetical protein